jgi:molecular chaperone DnaK
MVQPVGIDLGTTNSVISAYRRGKPETLRVEGAETMPSAVCFRDRSSILVGNKALNMAMIRPETTILSVKRNMGKSGFQYTIHGQTHTPIDISAMILQKLCEGHEAELGGKVTQAVITVPAYFTDAQKRDTKLAAEKAGLDVLRLLPEPTAAAIAIGLNRGKNQTILVYDLGGGTFDVSILQVEGNTFSVKAVNGNHDLGGNDFDRALRDHVLELFKKQKGIDLTREDPNDSQVRQAMQVLTSASERIKKELSEADSANLDLPNFFKGQHLEASITRATFEGLIKNQIYGTKELVLQTIKDAKLGLDDIDQLVLVGGSTKIPLVRRVLADTVREPYIADHVDLAVSHGAAIMAASMLDIDDPDLAPAELNVQDVVAHPIAVGMLDENRKMKCYVVIQKNAPLPATGMRLGVASPGQMVGMLPVFRGPNDDPLLNKFLGDLTLTFTPSLSPTLLRFELQLDKNGLLNVDGAEIDLNETPIEMLPFIPDDDIGRLKIKRRTSVELKMPD